MTAKVLSSVTINGIPANAGDVLEVDANTFNNLVLKGKLEAFKDEPKEEITEPIEKRKPKAKN